MNFFHLHQNVEGQIPIVVVVVLVQGDRCLRPERQQKILPKAAAGRIISGFFWINGRIFDSHHFHRVRSKR